MVPRLRSLLGGGVLAILMIMPFHAFLSIYLGTLTGQQAVIQAWKELLILFMALAAVGLVWKERRLLLVLLKKPLNLVALTYITFSLCLTVALANYGTDFWFGIKINLVFLVLFMVAQLADLKNIEARVIKILISTTAAVAAFGVLQITVLPKDFLSHFGYNESTILPYHNIDSALDSIRILSTLGGPNQLGSFLILPICLMTWMIIKQKKWWLIVPLILSGITLLHTFSRSAWLGTLVALSVTVLLSLPKRARLFAGFGLLAATTTAAALTLQLSLNNPDFGKYFFRAPSFESSTSSSDGKRLLSVYSGLEQLKANPFGKGLGEAGPASYKSNSAVITENYYLQVAVEVGLIGLLLLLAIMVLLAKKLYSLKDKSMLAVPLLGGLIGISIVNLFLHGWADSSTALIYWAAAGITLREQK